MVIARAIGPKIGAAIESYIFSNPPVAYVEGTIPMHGEEGADFAESLSRPVIKAVHVSHGRPDQVDAACPRWVVLLVDVHDPVRRGGTGATADWAWAAALAARRPVILSGGLHAGNVELAIRHFHSLKKPEFIHVVRGTVSVNVEGKSEQLNPGDSVYLRDTVPVQWKNEEGDQAELVEVW